MTKCIWCGRKVSKIYCSTSCQLHHEYSTGKRNRFTITKKANSTLREKGQYTRDNTYLKTRNSDPNIRAKISAGKMGEKNPQYGKRPWNFIDNGLSKSRYIKRADWMKAKKLALIRDGFSCQSCGMDDVRSKSAFNGQPLQVHHLVPYRTSRSHELSNLITLCCSCHAKATAVEQIERARN